MSVHPAVWPIATALLIALACFLCIYLRTA